MKQLLKYFLPYMLEYKKEFTFAILGMVAVAIGTTLTAHILKPVLDELFINKDREALNFIPFMIVAIFMFKSIGRFVQTYYTVYIGDDIVRRLRDRLSLHLMHQDMEYLNSMRSGELLSRITNDLNRIQQVVSTMIPKMMVNVMLIFTLTTYVIYQSPKLAFYFLVIMPLALFPLQILAKKMKRYARRSQESNSDLTSRLTEIFNNIEVIKSNSSQNFEQKRFSKENMIFFTLSIKQNMINALVGPTLEVFGSVAIAIAIFVGALQVMSDEITVGTFFAFITALFMLYDPIRVLSKIHNQLQDAVSATERLDELFNVKPTIISGSLELKDVSNIEFKDIYMKYGDKYALNGVSLNSKLGKVYALVGDSGAGKSSFINLIVRFYDVNKGDIYINDKNIKDYTLSSLHNKIAFVTQRVYIFQDTILANVAYGTDIDEVKVIEVLKSSMSWDFVSLLDNGIYTVLDEFGSNLSGGQRQRIALARALYKSPKILILDEATSALDNKSENSIKQVLDFIKFDMITFVVAHRLSTVESADEILLFENGKIVDRGNYLSLLDNSIKFRELVNSDY
jgi:subfamily B ATP-binding cassette protein MsbA